jgi:hypothetical protein
MLIKPSTTDSTSVIVCLGENIGNQQGGPFQPSITSDHQLAPFCEWEKENEAQLDQWAKPLTLNRKNAA